MILISFLKGMLVGLVVSVPTGPVGFLAVKRTVSDGFWAGFVTGLGVVVSDIVYGSIVIIGLRHTAHFWVISKPLFHLVGGALLVTLGVLTYFSKKTKHSKVLSSVSELTPMQRIMESRIGQFLSAFFVTMVNPIQIVSFTALIGSLAVFHSSIQLSVVFLSGLFVGALLWWTVLSLFTAKIRDNIQTKHIVWVNRIAGIVIVCSGFFVLLGFF